MDYLDQGFVTSDRISAGSALNQSPEVAGIHGGWQSLLDARLSQRIAHHYYVLLFEYLENGGGHIVLHQVKLSQS
jgi:hypothetical protein